ncbi:MAG: SUMF1/EgtB/PvdO family nonheme iron enzyme [Desulfovibrionaceae bacterium]|nr:SUMF1/EgtB/PvdO family nonheme iron enzyme [Desulfovibrionaceae bacterium]
MSCPAIARILLTAALLTAQAFPATDAAAAITAITAPISTEKTWNPRPADDDIILPMPCGLHMALRAVAVPGSLMQDRRFAMGVGGGDSQRQLYERRFEAHIAAPFTSADLPAAWKQRLPDDAAAEYTYYFIGKYEVSQHQWDAVMEEHCPAAPAADAALPRRGISWHDAQQFFQKYNAWLVQNAADALPRFAGSERNIGFLRLPTEEEWEFAARGGARVSEEDREHGDIFPLGDARLEDYGLFSGSVPVHEPAPIGSRLPNPLGLHDTVGNVKELVDGFFRLSVADTRGDGETYRRLHGAAGGILCKGGSFRSDARGVLPGWRDEVPPYTSEGESRPSDLGFRVALAGLNIPSAQRLHTLLQENAGRPADTPDQTRAPEQAAAGAERGSVTQDRAVQLDTTASPIAELDKISGAAATPEMRANLAQLRGMLEDQRSAQERQRNEVLENSTRALLYQEETLRGFAYRYAVVNGHLQKYLKSKGARADDPNAVKAREGLKEHYQLLLRAANFYKTGLNRVAGASPAEITRLLARLRQEYGGTDVLNRHMRQNIDALDRHLAAVRAGGIDSLTQKQLCRDIIPAQHFRELPFK